MLPPSPPEQLWRPDVQLNFVSTLIIQPKQSECINNAALYRCTRFMPQQGVKCPGRLKWLNRVLRNRSTGFRCRFAARRVPRRWGRACTTHPFGAGGLGSTFVLAFGFDFPALLFRIYALFIHRQFRHLPGFCVSVCVCVHTCGNVKYPPGRGSCVHPGVHTRLSNAS